MSVIDDIDDDDDDDDDYCFVDIVDDVMLH